MAEVNSRRPYKNVYELRLKALRDEKEAKDLLD